MPFLFIPRTLVCFLLFDNKHYVIISYILLQLPGSSELNLELKHPQFYFFLVSIFACISIFPRPFFFFWLYFDFLLSCKFWLEVHCIHSTNIYYPSHSFFFPVLFSSIALMPPNVPHILCIFCLLYVSLDSLTLSIEIKLHEDKGFVSVVPYCISRV